MLLLFRVQGKFLNILLMVAVEHKQPRFVSPSNRHRSHEMVCIVTLMDGTFRVRREKRENVKRKCLIINIKACKQTKQTHV